MLMFPFGRQNQERDLTDELRHDLEQREADYRRQGLPADEAARRARQDLGGVTQTRERCRDERQGALLETIAQDIRFGLRTIRLHPGFALVTIVTLAIGMGASIGVFSVGNAFFLQEMPVPEPERLVRVSGADENGEGFTTISYPNFLALREGCTAFEQLAVHRSVTAGLRVGDDEMPIPLELVSGNYFEMFDVRPELGRFFTDDDDVSPGGHPVAVISHQCWNATYAGAADVVGRVVTLNNHDYTIVGVAPDTLLGSIPASPTDVWVPVTMVEPVRAQGIPIDRRGWGWLSATGRLRDGVTLEEARADLARMSAQLATDHPRFNQNVTYVAQPAGMFASTDAGIIGLIVGSLSIVVGLMLALSCINIAGVLLARAMGRQHEMAIRLSMGATRGRLLRQMLTETTLLALLGSGLGLLVAAWTQNLIAWPLSNSGFMENFGLDVQADWRVYLFALGLALLTGAGLSLFTVARGGARSAAQTVVRSSGQASGGPTRARLQSTFVAGQVAIAVVMLIAAGLLLRTLSQARSLDVGFNTENMLVTELNVRPLGLEDAASLDYLDRLAEHVNALPGVDAVTYAMSVPLGGGVDNSRFQLDQPGPDGAPQQVSIAFNAIGPDYFDVMGIPVRSGRAFDATEQRVDAPPSIIINQTMADRYWPQDNPVGKRMFDGSGETAFDIVGVVADSTYVSLAESPRPFVYLPFAVAGSSRPAFQVRTQGDPGALARPVAQTLRRSDAALRMGAIMTLAEIRMMGLLPQRILGVVTVVFGLLALFLTAIGLYGTISCLVGRRTQEIGIRMALGALRANVLRMIAGRGLLLTAIGGAIGLAAAVGLTRFMESLLFGISATDPMTYVGVALMLVVVTLLASLAPARRATRIDPMIALRQE